ncbi:DoxX family protein [Nocardioides mesophilus]|uniref:DoxX family protein n=1 Tax=Nocardioides mesophilus TaxID=433659 RepID=A0A7G9R8K3_9ACTN|nr:DoxX family protein [Nocardioides mesophilus]QNN51928.1 DoxX family protein [Nocardioides mesophilus]
MTPIRLVARPMLASMFVVGGVGALRNSKAVAARSKPVTDRVTRALNRFAPQVPVPSDEVTLVRINGAAQVVSALALATGRTPRLASTVLALTLLPTTAAGHRFWEEEDAATRQNQRLHFFKNLSMLGGLMLAAVDTEGRPGVAWRTKHAVTDVRREAKHLRKEAKLAAKSIG